MSDTSSTNEHLFRELKANPRAFLAMALVVVAAVLALNVEGRVWWCPAGDLAPWAWNIWSQHNSQHIVDPYSFTHILHGVGEFWLIYLVLRRWPLAWRLLVSVMIASTWEVAENASFMIERYRTETISFDYFGDSIINSISDILCCAGGFLIAYKLGFWKSVAFFLATEAILIVWIRDSLLINILMLIYPIEAIKHWQTGG